MDVIARQYPLYARASKTSIGEMPATLLHQLLPGNQQAVTLYQRKTYHPVSRFVHVEITGHAIGQFTHSYGWVLTQLG